MPNAGCLPRSGLPGEKLQEDLLKNSEDDSDACREKPRRNPSQNKRCRVGKSDVSRKGLEYCNQCRGEQDKPDDETHQDAESDPLPSPGVDLLDEKRRRKEGCGEKKNV